MLRIGICDDSQHDRDLIRENVWKALFDYEDIEIAIFTSGQQVIEAIKQETFDCELLLLDIMMEPVDGMQVAEYIRTNKVDVDIIFVTQSAQYVYQGYIYKAFSYVLKESVEEDMGREVLRYVDELNASEECLNVTSKGKARRIPINTIRYIESNGRLLLIHLKKEDVLFYAKMGEIEPVLCERGFIRTHQSFMIREADIRSMTREQVNCGSYSVPISRRYYQEIRDIFDKKKNKEKEHAKF